MDVSAVQGPKAPLTSIASTNLRLTHPDLGFRIDVRLREFEGPWLAATDLADTPDLGVGETAEEALRGALASLGAGLSRGLAASVGAVD